jgi:hypothetical protein
VVLAYRRGFSRMAAVRALHAAIGRLELPVSLIAP